LCELQLGLGALVAPFVLHHAQSRLYLLNHTTRLKNWWPMGDQLCCPAHRCIDLNFFFSRTRGDS
jgi:hypothetical protein